MTTVEVARLIRPAVVQISTQQLGLDAYLRPLPRGGVGSGVIIDADGVILTNNHVVHGGLLSVILPDGRHFQGRLAGGDRYPDLAIVRVDARDLPQA